jgi:thiamine-monophosphate kinase
MPEPRLELGQALSRLKCRASAMIDISDGISSDLRHLCEASGVGARIEQERLPLSDAYRRCSSRRPELKPLPMLHGGEDYELLFTLSPEVLAGMDPGELPGRVTQIGEMVPAEEGISVLLPDGRWEALRALGYDHFRQD